MKSRLPAFLWAFAASTLVAVACGGTGGSDAGGDASAGGAGGSGGGTAGKGGASGASGKSGASGGAGKAGSSGATGGSSGAAGKAGAAGASGGAGKAGASGASGKGGSSGASGASGAAGASCAAPKQQCGATCTDTGSDPKNCGMCGMACPVPAGSVATCAAGKCASTCAAGFGNCDGNAANGCETQTVSDPMNCGMCGKACPSGGGTPAQCAGGTCGLMCAAGTLDCDKDPTTGCEANINDDPNNCGSCGMKCGSGACVMGACSCAGTTQTAELLPLDIFLLQDRSGSMTEATSTGATKWDAMKAAMTAFVNDPASAGLGMGLNYFPENSANVPATCTTSAQCGAFGPCDTVKFCKLAAQLGQLVPCLVKADCGGGDTCVAFGECANNHQYVCPTIGAQCGTDPMGNNLGKCQAVPSFCQAQTCDTATYATPAVGIAGLPANAGAISGSLAATAPGGGTPTTPALTGAIQYASSWATMNPTHTTVVILATDGLPNDCSSDVNGVAAAAAAGNAATPRIRTFVIGIFSDADIQAGAPANLDTIAASGGGQSTAIIVQTNADVTMQLEDALNKIRQSTLSCDYKVPVPAMGTLDPNKVNVIFTDAMGAKQTLLYVGAAASCDPMKGGWYYDDPANPTKIIVCKSTCDGFQNAVGSKVDIQLGCATVKP